MTFAIFIRAGRGEPVSRFLGCVDADDADDAKGLARKAFGYEPCERYPNCVLVTFEVQTLHLVRQLVFVSVKTSPGKWGKPTGSFRYILARRGEFRFRLTCNGPTPSRPPSQAVSGHRTSSLLRSGLNLHRPARTGTYVHRQRPKPMGGGPGLSRPALCLRSGPPCPTPRRVGFLLYPAVRSYPRRTALHSGPCRHPRCRVSDRHLPRPEAQRGVRLRRIPHPAPGAGGVGCDARLNIVI
jgi:hypothetical protein